MKKRIENIKIICSQFQTKLMLAFFLCTLLPLAVIACIFYHITYRIAADKIMSSTILADDQLNMQFNERIGQAENVADSIQYDMYSLTRTGESITEALSVFNNARNDVSLFKTTFDFYHIYVFLPDTKLGAKEGLYFLPLSEISQFGLPGNWQENPGTDSIWFYQTDVELPFILSEAYSTKDLITCCRILHNQANNSLEYGYFIFLNPDEFSGSLSNAFSGTAITSYLVSETGQILAHTDSTLSGTHLPEDKMSLLEAQGSIRFESDGINYHAVQLNNGWYHITEIPENYIKENTRILLRTIIVTLVIALPLTILTIITMSGNLTRRLRKLSLAMKDFSLSNPLDLSSYDLLPSSKNQTSYDEIDKLIITFDKMQTSINQNMHSILELSLSEEKLRYQLLQSQINPHFLYNILGSIKTCQTIGRLDTANQMITDLTQFYRLTLRKTGDLISIRDELEIARLYLEMEKLCHDDTLTWEIHAEDGIENYRMCRFTLQPFLENSILHGISRITPRVHLKLFVCYGEDTVIITIQDDGIGISPRQLDELRTVLEEKTVDYDKHFGIGNVNRRISSPSFGHGSIQIESRVGEGTKITIIFAQMEEENA
ncbi:sensor histidine kinase [Novisyntrophococcus fermenticellae]|uniref:sensor histidine kinase n=1 Tax=Novisyntrophococcus fermenticellae TaxID=2068655 RepID=UPI001E5FDAF0|nr:histidine kinase [Novisyntrophococcus fermenticellae]